eukprot:5896337-Amphidinium_carterae.2
MPGVPSCLWDNLSETLEITPMNPPADVNNGETFQTWFEESLHGLNQEKLLVIFTPPGYEAVDFYVVLPDRDGAPYVVGCQTKVWTVQDKTDKLHRSRQAALNGTGTASEWKRLVPCKEFVCYVGADLPASSENWIITPSTMVKHFSRSILRACCMSD